jgi:16S rRNA (cytosine967-C5)-methyltransferase
VTPAARVQAAIDLVDEIIAAARSGGAAADTLIVRYFKARRYAGSGDRRAVRDLVYAAIRRSGECPVSGRAALIGLADDRPQLAAAFDGSHHGPAPIEIGEPATARGVVPAWLEDRLAATVPPADRPALLGRAPLDLRVNRLKAARDDVLAELGEAEAGYLSPYSIRLSEGFAVEKHPLFLSGRIEVQDEGSQLVALATRVKPGDTAVDLCAGAGGKTLALAAMMDGRGRLIACDVDRRLARLEPRAIRAGIGPVEMRLLDAGREAAGLADLAGQADTVLVDAPCSGTGTWRRNPEARWRLTPERLDRLIVLQDRVLGLGATLVRPGGRMTYAVCSVLADEGRDRVARFIEHHPDWAIADLPFSAGRTDGTGRLLTPANDGTDGFFIASLIRPC